jgi:outer membrane protein
MKRVCFAAVMMLFLVGLFGVCQASAQALKIGVYDTNRIFQESKTIAGYNAELSKSIEAKRSLLIQKENALKELVEKLKTGASTMTVADKRVLEERIVNEDKELKRLREDVEQELRKVQAELRQRALIDINKAVTQVGEKENYTLIFEKSAAGVAYLKDSADITGKILNQVK